MRTPFLILVAVAWMSGWSSPALCQDDPSDDFPPALIHDPSLATSVYFPPTVTTAGVAYTGPALGASSRAGARAFACTPTNPCAMVTPAADSVLPAR
jgi:hypothetical protein